MNYFIFRRLDDTSNCKEPIDEVRLNFTKFSNKFWKYISRTFFFSTLAKNEHMKIPSIEDSVKEEPIVGRIFT